MPKPLSLLAELTYRCNLRCPYCYNPVDLGGGREELDEAAWLRVVDQAAALGVLQLHLSGGEPTLRPELAVALTARARRHDMYVNLITQGTFLSAELLDEFVAAGLDHVQISVQAAHAPVADAIAGASVHERKLHAFARALRRPLAVTMNCVLHRDNIDGIADLIALAERVGVRRLELANTQFYGWAFANRGALLPSRTQVARARAVVADAERRLRGQMEIAHVLSDYFEEYPKPCMGGWGGSFVTVAPDGRVLPCPAASAITTLTFDDARATPLAEIWEKGAAFTAFRGSAWMPEPCASCPRKDVDLGGCRCQAFLLLGDARLTDPVCRLSPHHGVIEAMRVSAEPVLRERGRAVYPAAATARGTPQSSLDRRRGSAHRRP